MKTVLIIDDDLGFVFWLGHALDAAGYSALPARTVPDAALLIMQLELTVDVLLIDPGLAGGLEFISVLSRSQKGIHVIEILDDRRQYSPLSDINAANLKPTVFNEVAKNKWIQCIEQVLMGIAPATNF